MKINASLLSLPGSFKGVDLYTCSQYLLWLPQWEENSGNVLYVGYYQNTHDDVLNLPRHSAPRYPITQPDNRLLISLQLADGYGALFHSGSRFAVCPPCYLEWYNVTITHRCSPVWANKTDDSAGHKTDRRPVRNKWRRLRRVVITSGWQANKSTRIARFTRRGLNQFYVFFSPP